MAQTTPDLTAKKRAFMLRYTNAVLVWMQARNTLLGISSEWNALGYAAGITQTDIQDLTLLHLSPAVLASGIASLAALEADLTANNNLHLSHLHALIGA